MLRTIIVLALVALSKCESWNATGVVSVSLPLTANSTDEWNVEIGISQYNTTSPGLLTSHIRQLIFADISQDPACSQPQANAICQVSWGGNGSQHDTYEKMQNDPGDCSSGIPSSCRSDLTTTVREFFDQEGTKWQYNISLCTKMGSYVLQHVPESCSSDPDMQALLAYPYGGKFLSPDRDCQKRSIEVTGFGLEQIVTFDNKTIKDFEEQYDYFQTKVTPMMLVSFPVNNDQYPILQDDLSTQLVCLRPKNVTQGSQVANSVPDLLNEAHRAGSVSMFAVVVALAFMLI